MLKRGITFLNHGSFGAVPRAVFDEHTIWRQRVEAEPIEILYRQAKELRGNAKRAMGQVFGMVEDDFGLVTNATEGVNAVLRSLSFGPGDELATTTHVYNAVRQAMRYVAARAGATVREIDVPTPLNSAEQIERLVLDGLSPNTKLLVIDHVTSPTALIFPVERIVAKCAERGIDVLIDGAQGPGMLPLNVASLGAAYYSGNLHKWVCAPKGSAFVWVRPDRQAAIHPLSISHYLGEGFAAEFGWQGTRDFGAWLAIPSALAFFSELGWERVRAYNHALAVWTQNMLCDRWGVEPLTSWEGQLLGSMCTVPLPPPLDGLNAADAAALQARLYHEEQIEVPIMQWAGRAHVRPCCQVYNVAADYEKLADAIGRHQRL